jgi:ABC-type dipeptide/oligopeptide/nickel transport system permease subunit
MSTTISLAQRQERDEDTPARSEQRRLSSIAAYCRRNPQLVAGVVVVCVLLLVGPVVFAFRRRQTRPAAFGHPGHAARGRALPLGNDDQGRDLLAVMVADCR